jgi:multiple sugar transport system ATP-binding protein
MTTLTLNNVVKTFTDDQKNIIRAVDDMTIRIPSGEVLGLLGASGCGKSTMLRLVAGIETPDSGEILYDRLPLVEVPMQNRGIGMVFQEGALVPHWNAEENIGFFMRLRKREHEVPDRVRRISQITGIGIEQLLDRRPSQLSGGERQRVGIARALTRDLNLLLFDEPFSNLDAKLRTQARVELKRLLNEFPVTSIYVTHDQEEALALADRIAIMHEGKIIQVGNFHQLYHSPINLFVAQFFGTPPMNFFKGTVQDGKWYGENFGGHPLRRDLPNGTAVTMGIRPPNFFLQAEGVPVVVDQVIPLIAEKKVMVDVWIGSEHWSMMFPLDDIPVIGTTIYCQADFANAHFFDTQNGRRIG